MGIFPNEKAAERPSQEGRATEKMLMSPEFSDLNTWKEELRKRSQSHASELPL